jgi:hypothetical protein
MQSNFIQYLQPDSRSMSGLPLSTGQSLRFNNASEILDDKARFFGSNPPVKISVE